MSLFIDRDPTDGFTTYRATQTGERGLVYAVLEQAICDLLRPIQGRSALLDQESALYWIQADHPRWPYTFTYCCETLDINPGRLRKRILSAFLQGAARTMRSPREAPHYSS